MSVYINGVEQVVAHDLGGPAHNVDTLANLNAKVSDATLDDEGATRTPTAHQASHQKAAADALAGTIAITQVEVG